MLTIFLILNLLLLVIIVIVAGGVLFFVFKDRMPEKVTKKSSVKALRKEINKILDELEKVAKGMETEGNLTALTKQLETILEEHEKGGSEND